MKSPRILLLLAVLAGCSKPSYLYRFQNNSQYTFAQANSSTQTHTITTQKQGALADGNNSTPVNHPTNSILLASASRTPVIHTSSDTNLRSKKISRAKTPVTSINRSAKITNQAATGDDQEGDPTKNNAATIGLAFSLASMTILFGFVLAPLFAIPAIILCVNGLKSEKKKMAKIGLILSIAALGLGLIFLLYLAASGGYGM